jgi:UDP-2,3-diacylglucosamine hydrolase
VTAVLGTPVQELAADGRPALLISDLHVPVDGGAVLARLDSALAHAERLGARVFVLGDLFDSYVGRRQVRVGIWRDVAARFAAAHGAGVEVQMLVGNRDFLLGPEFARAARLSLWPGGLRVRLAGVDTLLLHGDELCQNDVPYQRAKRWLRHPVTVFILRNLPLRTALWVAERARARSRKVVAYGDQGRFLPTRTALDAAFATGVGQVVFGHIHRRALGPWGGGRYWVLPAFDAEGIGLLVTPDGLQALRFSGALAAPEPVPPPPELSFPA